jgi:hypothetical protein
MYDAWHIFRLDQRTCTCGRWQLNVIPCFHAYDAIYIFKQKLEAYLNGYYMIDKYIQGYTTKVYAMQGPNT